MYLPPFAKKISQNAHILFKLRSKIVSFHIRILSGNTDLTFLFCAEFTSHVKVFVNFVTRQGYSYLCVFAPAVPNPQNKKWKLGKWTIYFSVPLKVEDACAYFFFKWGG